MRRTKDLERQCHFFSTPLYRINTRCVPDAGQRLIRGSEIYPMCVAHC